MGDWDDDDFEVDVKQLDEKKHTIVEDELDDKVEDEQVEPTHVAAAVPEGGGVPSKAKKKAPKEPLNTFTSDLSRELTEKEKEQLQRRADLALAKDLFGLDTDEPLTYADLESLDEFRTFGEKIGKMLSTRSNATHYLEMLSSLLKVVAVNLDANKARYLSTMLKTMADEKTAAEKKTKVKGAAAKPTIKSAPRSGVPSTKANKALYDDYVADEYDDYADDFM